MSALARSKLWLAQKLAGSALGGGIVSAQRARKPLGAWTGELAFEPRRVNPFLYEALREALPVIDGAIEKLVTLDGLVTVEGDSDALVAEIAEWMAAVPVNDLQAGLQSAYAGQGNELYEQGFGIIERTVKGRDIVNLRVADSKGVRFLRGTDGVLRVYYAPPGTMANTRFDGTEQLERILRGSSAFATANTLDTMLGMGYVELDREALLCAVNMPEADDPYGTSKLRSIEVVSEIILRIENATGRVWERFGDPTFNILYQTKNKTVANDPAALAVRATEIASRLATALSAKANGNSADFVNAIGIDDKLTVEILGAVSAVLEIEAPARHLLEQVVAKFGIPSWMLGQHWSTAERLAETQGELALMESRTRWSTRKPSLDALVETMLRLRGRTWKAGDWQLVQVLPNLADELKKAQAEFMRGQTVMMLSEQTPGEAPASPAEPGSDARGGGGKALTAVQIAELLEQCDTLDEVPSVLANFGRTKQIAGAALASAISWLKKAIKLHEGHMDGSIATTDASQRKMMKQMQNALSFLTGEDSDDMKGLTRWMKQLAGAALASAISWLKKAIKLHEGHMDGSIPTTDASQQKMMKQMKKALSFLTGQESDMGGMD